MRLVLAILVLSLPMVLMWSAGAPNEEHNVVRRHWKFGLSVVASFFHTLGGGISSVSSSFRLPYCSTCKLVTSVVQTYLKQNRSEEEMINFLRTSCKMFQFESNRVCDGVITHFKDEFFYVLGRTTLNPTQICGTVFPEDCDSQPAVNWTVPIPTKRRSPPEPFPSPKKGAPTLRVLHISDTHVDPLYREGSLANCKEPLCCHSDDGQPSAPGEVPAGRWGYYHHCDIPARTFESMLKNIRDTQKIDYVIWTGDIVAHDIWNTSRKTNLEIIDYTIRALVSYLPGIPVFPALGNHEGEPVDSFPLPGISGNISISWLYEALAKQWSRWLPESTVLTLKKGGFYAVNAFPGLKIVSLNMNYCNSLNWWLLLNDTDPEHELSWLVAQLQDSEIKGEKVHIIGHIPPGVSDCLRVWSDNYHKIISRYEDTVRSQFFGHTHMDELEVFYDAQNKKRALGVAYLAPSATTYNSGNPAYRIYTVDGNYPNSTWAVLDHETFTMNLTEANNNPNNEPKWSLEYSALKAYNMTSLHPQEWDRVLRLMEDDGVLFDKFHRFYSKHNPLQKPCDADCRKNLLCKQRTSRSADLKLC